ncbi:MAG: MGMT family protein [Oscillospiraceae bacterium]|nr:MGMT family protein [Oscillospiraceae bacterium]
MPLFKEIYEMCKKIPKGKVATYGQIAILIGRPRCARQVGWALHGVPEEENVPCHRVVNRFGGLCKCFGFGGPEMQKQLLEAEGIHVRTDYTVDLKEYIWEN